MAIFVASLIDSNGDSSVTLDCTTGLVTITDSSNYTTNDEEGHATSDFSNYRKVIVTKNNGETYTYSSLGDGDATILPASSLDNDVTYTIGDSSEILSVALITIPTYGAGNTYDTTVLVYSGGILYHSLQNGNIGHTPASSPTWWEVVADTQTALSAYESYYATQQVSVYCQMYLCRDSLTNDAFCASEDCGCCGTCDLCENDKFLKSVEMEVLIRAFNMATINNDWDRIQCIFDRANQLCC